MSATAQHHTYTSHEPLALENGGTFRCLTLAYTTYGQLNAQKSNVIWVCHALTANADFTDWWSGLFGPGRLYDPEKYFVVCANMPGSCYGSTGPLSVNPCTERPYYHSFPKVTNRDVVNAFERLRQHLHIDHIHTLIGGSLGGQQVLEWALQAPELFGYVIPVATNAWHSPWGIAFNESQRMAIEQDLSWQLNTEQAGMDGLHTARAIALLSYRNYGTYNRTQQEENSTKTDAYKAASYQRYQGLKLAKRFNAFSYWHLSKMMDSHQLGRNRRAVPDLLKALKVPMLVVGVKSDLLFPFEEQEYLANHLPQAQLAAIDSPYGHDGFLIEFEQLTQHIHQFYQTTSKSSSFYEQAN